VFEYERDFGDCRWFLLMQQRLVWGYIQYSVFRKNISLGSRTFTRRQAVNRSVRIHHKLENSHGVFLGLSLGKTKKMGGPLEPTNLCTHSHSAFRRKVQPLPKILVIYIFFIYLEFFNLPLLSINYWHYKFKGFLKQRIIYSKCHKCQFLN